MKFVLLVFDSCPHHPTTGEEAGEVFMRRFEDYRGLREQIGAAFAVEVPMMPGEAYRIQKRRLASDHKFMIPMVEGDDD